MFYEPEHILIMKASNTIAKHVDVKNTARFNFLVHVRCRYFCAYEQQEHCRQHKETYRMK